jgi:hypothetical protein
MTTTNFHEKSQKKFGTPILGGSAYLKTSLASENKKVRFKKD